MRVVVPRPVRVGVVKFFVVVVLFLKLLAILIVGFIFYFIYLINKQYNFTNYKPISAHRAFPLYLTKLEVSH